MLGSGIRVLIQHSQGGIAVVAAATVLTGYSQLTGWENHIIRLRLDPAGM